MRTKPESTETEAALPSASSSQAGESNTQQLEDRIAELTLELAKKDELLAQVNQSMSEFVYMASHDLMGPSRRIQGFAKLLQKKLPKQQLEGEISDFFRFLMESSELMSMMITDIVHISRLKPSGYEWQTVELPELLESVVNEFGEQKPVVKFKFSQNDLPNVYGNHDQIERLFQNLIGNAIKFRRPDEPLAISISSEYDEPKQQVEFIIRDNGLGIHQHELKAVLRPFTRGIDTKATPGTGLGLAMCTRICQLHRGRLWIEHTATQESAESSDTIGTEIRVRLPAAPK